MPKSKSFKLALAVVVILTVAGIGYAGLTIWRDSTEKENRGRALVSEDQAAEDESVVELPSSSEPETIEVGYPSRYTGYYLHLKLNGEVVRGRPFKKEITSNLLFRLIPREHGWDIWVGNKTSPGDFTFITPPFHGFNNRYVYGWHFAQTNTNSF